MLELTVELPVLVALVEADGIRVDDGAGGFERLEACAAGYRERYSAQGVTAPGSVDGVGAARDLFRDLRIDATRHRPSSEALLNRALKDRPLPRINTLVDAGNWCSLDFLLPLGVYDREKLRGPVVLREGRAGEGYEALNGRVISLGGRYLLADDAGPFGSPITDSVRTAVSDGTTRVVIVLYAPADSDRARFQARAQMLGARVVECCGGEVEAVSVHGGSPTTPTGAS